LTLETVEIKFGEHFSTGGLVGNNKPLFFTTSICTPRPSLADETKKLCREGEVHLALPPPIRMIIIIDNQPSFKAYSQ
jgi:hypothetical protein